MLPVFPYSRQPDVRYIQPDARIESMPAMLFKDSYTVSAEPAGPINANYADNGPSVHFNNGLIDESRNINPKPPVHEGPASVIGTSLRLLSLN